jgi:RNA polymerase sigma factor (sigma-70 family)
VARPPLRLKGPEKQKLVDLANQPLTAEQKAMVEAYAKAWPWPAGIVKRAYYKTYALAKSFGIDDEELSQICWFGAFRAARTYDPSYKASFATYAVSKMRGLLSHWIALQQSACRRPPNVLLSLDVKFAVPKGEQGEEDRSDEIDEYRRQLGVRLGSLSARERSMVVMYYGLDGKPTMTFKAVGEHFHLTRSRTQQIVTRAVRKLKSY